MGFDSNGTRLLIKAKELGVKYDKVLTVGRQGLHLEIDHLQQILADKGFPTSSLNKVQRGAYSEPFLKTLGAQTIDSIDASNYEKATIIHDLNHPISDQLKNKFTAVIDGGSLEHVFNFPVAIKNCMEMVEPGGHFIGISPTNNFTGHGFYQFSPEIYYRIFCRANGFELMKMYFYISKKDADFYEVADPNDVKERVTIVNSTPSYLFVIAKRIAVQPIFAQHPMQSDYENILWEKKDYANAANTKNSTGLLRKMIPNSFKRLIKNWFIVKQPTGISKDSFFKKTNDI